MVHQMTGTVIDGAIQLDQPIPLPNATRVQVTFEPDRQSPESAIAAWESLKQFMKEHPLNSGGLRFTRDELHERH